MTADRERTSPLNPAAAAVEGLRLIRREPASALVWLILWSAFFMATAILVAKGERVVVSRSGAPRSMPEIAQQFGSYAVICIAMFLLLWATTSLAVYRAVLRPNDRRFCYLRMGADEMRLAILSVASFFLVLLLGGVPAYLLLVLADPLMRALPGFARDIATVGALATVCVEIWLGVRLSLISVETFAERRFHLSAYWPLTHGRFWYLLGCYALCFVALFALSIVLFVVGAVVTAVAQPDLGPGNLWRRGGVLGLAVFMALITGAVFSMSSTIFCACQAYAFRRIVGDGKAGVAIA